MKKMRTEETEERSFKNATVFVIYILFIVKFVFGIQKRKFNSLSVIVLLPFKFVSRQMSSAANKEATSLCDLT